MTTTASRPVMAAGDDPQRGWRELARRAGWRVLARRAGWVAVDQAISSLSNAGLSLLVARAVGVHSYGGFAVAFTIYASLLGISEAAGGSPFAIRSASETGDALRRSMAGAAAWPVVFGTAAGLVTIVVGLSLSGDPGTGKALVAVGIFLPVMFLQDCWRLVLITTGRARSAAANDLAWGLIQFALIGVLIATGNRSAWTYVVVWGIAAAVGAVYGMIQTKTVPALRLVTGWLRQHRDISLYFGAEWMTVLGASQLSLLITALVSGVDTVGSLRGALTLLGPLNLVAFSTSAFAIPELARRRLSSRANYAVAGGTAALLVLIVLVWGTVLLVMPDSTGVSLLGATWHSTRHILPAMIAWSAANMVGFGPYVVLRSRGRARATFTVNACQAPLLIIGAVVGVMVDGALGAATGLAIGAWIVTPLWLVQLRRAFADGSEAGEVG
jgi:O-antigen/teichoic acid export membrane protein